MTKNIDKETQLLKSKLECQGQDWAIAANRAIMRAAMIIEMYANKQHRRYGTTQPGMAILYELIRNDGEIPQKQLANVLERTKQAIALVLIELEKRHLIIREIGDHDRRRKTIRITNEGLKLATECIPLREEYYDSFSHSMEQFEARQLIISLDKVCSRLTADIKKSGKSKKHQTKVID